MPPLNSKNPVNVLMYHSAFKLSIYFNNNKRKCCPFHSVESPATVAQVRYKKIKQIEMNRKDGFNGLIQFAEKLADKIHVAFLYDAFEENVCYAKFQKGKWKHLLHPDFTKEFVQISSNFQIVNGFIICTDLPVNALANNAKFLHIQ